jgi:anti-sigma regulatory factor (Ser/Thr protein kinase)
LVLAALPSAAFWARRCAEAALGAWRLQQDDIETAQLLVSELVTNSVKFTGAPSAPVIYSDLPEVKSISLILRHRSDTLIIEVCDPDPTPPILSEASPNAEGGRGLMLVRALSKEWNYYLPPSGGKTVYCVISAERPADGRGA